MELLHSLAGEVQTRRSKCEATTQQLEEPVARVEELELKVRLLADEARQVGELQR